MTLDRELKPRISRCSSGGFLVRTDYDWDVEQFENAYVAPSLSSAMRLVRRYWEIGAEVDKVARERHHKAITRLRTKLGLLRMERAARP